MTYRDLLTDVKMTVQVLSQGITDPVEWEGAQTTKVRYATKKNRDRLQGELDTYQELVSELSDDHDLPEEEVIGLIRAKLNGGIDGESDAVAEDVQSLLQQETDFTPYTISEEALMQESNVPLPVLDLVDWMVEDHAA